MFTITFTCALLYRIHKLQGSWLRQSQIVCKHQRHSSCVVVGKTSNTNYLVALWNSFISLRYNLFLCFHQYYENVFPKQVITVNYWIKQVILGIVIYLCHKWIVPTCQSARLGPPSHCKHSKYLVDWVQSGLYYSADYIFTRSIIRAILTGRDLYCVHYWIKVTAFCDGGIKYGQKRQ